MKSRRGQGTGHRAGECSASGPVFYLPCVSPPHPAGKTHPLRQTQGGEPGGEVGAEGA